MATVTTPLPTDRHSWLDTFVADPASELDNLLSGHARIEPYESADAPDAARLLFGGLPEGHEALAALDRVVREWLDIQRAAGVPGLDQLPLERWLRKVSEAFEIVALLRLRHSALDLRRRFVVWNSWGDRLAISAQRDGRYAFLRTLALTQRIVAEAGRVEGPGFRISVRSLTRWWRCYNRLGDDGQICAVGGLVDQYLSTDVSKNNAATRTSEAVVYFYDLYHTQNRLSVKICHETALREARL